MPLNVGDKQARWRLMWHVACVLGPISFRVWNSLT